MTAVPRGPGAKPVLAFAHANGVPGHSYDTFLAPFAEQYDVRVAECLGQDPRYPVDRNWHSLSRELEAFLEPLPKPMVGMGHSLGSVLMFLIAERHPQWFSELVMLDPPVVNGPAAWLVRAARLVGLGDYFSPAHKSRGRLDYWASWDEVLSYFHSRRFFQSFDPRALADYLEHGLERHGDGWRLRFRPEIEVAIFREMATGVTRMPPVKVPGVLINGEDSPSMFHYAGKRHARRHGLTRLLAPGGHMYPLQTPEASAALVMKALDDLRLAQQKEERHASRG